MTEANARLIAAAPELADAARAVLEALYVNIGAPNAMEHASNALNDLAAALAKAEGE